jgi:hypothetical protein
MRKERRREGEKEREQPAKKSSWKTLSCARHAVQAMHPELPVRVLQGGAERASEASANSTEKGIDIYLAGLAV